MISVQLAWAIPVLGLYREHARSTLLVRVGEHLTYDAIAMRQRIEQLPIREARLNPAALNHQKTLSSNFLGEIQIACDCDCHGVRRNERRYVELHDRSRPVPVSEKTDPRRAVSLEVSTMHNLNARIVEPLHDRICLHLLPPGVIPPLGIVDDAFHLVLKNKRDVAQSLDCTIEMEDEIVCVGIRVKGHVPQPVGLMQSPMSLRNGAGLTFGVRRRTLVTGGTVHLSGVSVLPAPATHMAARAAVRGDGAVEAWFARSLESAVLEPSTPRI